MESNINIQLLWLVLSGLLEKRRESEEFSQDALIDWELAQNRILLYLRASNIDPDQCLMLAMRAYKRAQKNVTGKREPVADAMISLRKILMERNIIPDQDIDFGAPNWRKWAQRFPALLHTPEKDFEPDLIVLRLFRSIQEAR